MGGEHLFERIGICTCMKVVYVYTHKPHHLLQGSSQHQNKGGGGVIDHIKAFLAFLWPHQLVNEEGRGGVPPLLLG